MVVIIIIDFWKSSFRIFKKFDPSLHDNLDGRIFDKVPRELGCPFLVFYQFYFYFSIYADL